LTNVELAAYDHIPEDLAARARVTKVPFLTPGSSGMTLGRWVFLRNDSRRDGTSKLLAHELVHVQQWHDLGVRRFLWRYLAAYFRAVLRLRNHRRAYLVIPFEVEAYDRADEWMRTRASVDR
jgi:hypothetical protein